MEPQFSDVAPLLDSFPSGSKKGGRFLVIYDGACYFCIFSVRFLKRIDFLGQYSYITLQEFSRKDVKIPYSILQESIHVVDSRRKKVWKSTSAISVLLRRSPPAIILLILLDFLRLIGIAEPAYKWVAQYRYEISSILKK